MAVASFTVAAIVSDFNAVAVVSVAPIRSIVAQVVAMFVFAVDAADVVNIPSMNGTTAAVDIVAHLTVVAIVIYTDVASAGAAIAAAVKE